MVELVASFTVVGNKREWSEGEELIGAPLQLGPTCA